MKTDLFTRAILAAGLFTPVVLVAAAFAAGNIVPTDPAGGCTVTSAAFSSWFAAGAVTKDGAVTPADSLNFAGRPNCDFYEWSERMFLWTTSPVTTAAGGKEIVLNSSEFFDVSPEGAARARTLIQHQPNQRLQLELRTSQVGAHGFPVVHTKSGGLAEIAPPLGPHGMPLIQNREISNLIIGANGTARFRDVEGRDLTVPRRPPAIRQGRSAPPLVQQFVVNGRAVFVDLLGDIVDVELGQAETGGVLMAQNGSLVYYALEVNDVFAFFASGVNSGAIPHTPSTTFPTDPAALQQVVQFAAQKGRAFAHPEALTIEMKTSWVEAVNLPSGCNYITMQAKIPTYDTSKPEHWIQNGSKLATLAMVGLHVVGSTKGHPEMIWATFEHICNAPHPGYVYDAVGQQGKAGPTETGPWLFAATDNPAPPGRRPRMRFNAGPPAAIDAVAPATTVAPGDVLRVMPWGTKPSNAESNTEIVAMNNSIRSQLTAGDIRANYILIGATWTAFGVLPDQEGALEVGTEQLSNATMETFQQPGNCFSCHFGGGLGDNTGDGLSHIVGELKPLP